MRRVQIVTRTNCMAAHWRTGWISDFHLGMKGVRAGVLLDFLRENEFDRLYLVGDIIDVLALKRGIFWPQEHNDVIQKLLRKGRKGTELIYIPGNHDGFVSDHLGTYGSVTLQKHAIHTTADGKRILVFHGHELDVLVQNLGWLGYAGDLGYTVLLRSNGVVNLARRLLGMDAWSLSAYVKGRVRNVAKFISSFEEAVVRYAQAYGVDGVICGHIHTPTVRQIGAIQYYNTGDWIESCTALVESFEGTIKLVHQAEARVRERAGDLDRESVGAYTRSQECRAKFSRPSGANTNSTNS